MEAVDLDITRVRAVLAMFRITQGELARASGVSPAMVGLLLSGRKHPSARIAVARVHGLERLLTVGRRLSSRMQRGAQVLHEEPKRCSLMRLGVVAVRDGDGTTTRRPRALTER